MKTYQRTIKNGNYVSGVEVFFLSGDKKNPKQRLAYVDSKTNNFVSSGTCKCGGNILEVMRSPVDWRVCSKCGKDHSVYSFPRRLIGYSGDLPKSVG